VVSPSVAGSPASVSSLQPGRVRPLLTVVVPVYNGGEEIVDNVTAIRTEVGKGLGGEALELIVVSDGSIDGTAERLLESRSEDTRVIHYDRNLGKGYAVKAGALAARGDWVALVDADLDLDPASVPEYLAVAIRDGLDFAIGSKRHPDSVVEYPRSRRIASWLYQQLNRILFRLDVRDTQVGLKVFSRDVVDEIVPLLLVKQFAFDLELLAVASALGRGRIEELPVRLTYRFSGSALRSAAVLRALWDTAAIFYRLRILRTYQRKRGLVADAKRVGEPPVVSVVGGAGTDAIEYDRLERVDAARLARGELVGLLGRRARPAGNWIAAAVPYFGDPDVAAVVTPIVAPLRGTVRERAAAAVLESRIGGASRRSRHFPGNVRIVADFPADGVVVRRTDLVEAEAAGVETDSLVAWLAERGRRTLYTPDSSVSMIPPPVFGPHLRETIRHARARGAAARRSRGSSLSVATLLSLLPALCAVAGIVLLATKSDLGLVLVAVYLGVLCVSALLAAVRFRSAASGLLTAPALAATQAAYVVGFVQGLVRGR
jgi:glycosyltransferase involved in cell wall biosynthesis